MSFGPINAPTFFVDLMNPIFWGLLNRYVLVFIDDMLVYSVDEKDHEIHLMLLLETLRQHKLVS